MLTKLTRVTAEFIIRSWVVNQSQVGYFNKGTDFYGQPRKSRLAGRNLVSH